MVLSTETFNQSVRTEYSEAVNARYTFQGGAINANTWIKTSTQDVVVNGVERCAHI